MKMRNKDKRLIRVFFIVLLMIVLCPLIIADLGLSSDYHGENPIKVDLGYDGEIIIGRFINNGNEDINLEIELVEGFEIAEIVDDKLRVPANSKEGLRIKISVPGDASRGDDYNVGIKYTEAGSGEEGMIVITTSNTVFIPVLIQEVDIVPGEVKGISKKSVIWVILGILVVIIVTVVIKFVLKEKQAFSEPTM